MNLAPDYSNPFSDVYQLESTDDAQAGAGGIMNLQAQQLLNRTEYLLRSSPIIKDYVPMMSLVGLPGIYIASAITDSGKAFYIDYTVPSSSLLEIRLPYAAVLGLIPDGTTFTFDNRSFDSFIKINATVTTGAQNQIYDRYLSDTYIIVRPMERVTLRRVPNFGNWLIVERTDVASSTFEGTIFSSSVGGPRAVSCNGAAISRTKYKKLFGQISTIYGVGDGSTTFNVPNISSFTASGPGGGIVLNYYIAF